MTAAAVSPTGGTMTLVRDAMNRIVGVTDPLSRVTQYGYDPRGLLAQVTLPGGGTATYRRDAAGALDRIADLNGNDWGFTRSPMGRMSTAADPLNQVRQSAYDSRGRPQQTTFPDATTLTLTTDGRGNPTRFRYSGGPDLHYGYDSLNRLTDADGLHLIYDVEGRITGTDDAGMTFGATRDDAGRVIAATYANGAFTVNYAYAPATGLLSTVSDTLTGAQVQFTYDADQRLIGIQRSNGVSTALTWNASSLLTGLADGKAGNAPFIDIQGTFNAAGRLASSQPTVPLAPESVLAQDSRIFTYDAASQVSSAGFTYDRRGRLTAGPGRSYAWDGASRLTGADGATLTYNGLNDLRTRSSGGTNRHHYYQYALGFKPLVAERNGDSGPFTRYYVWTPGGKLLYMIDANAANKVYFYHFDRGGSTLALTDERAAVTDVYAYTPYGAVLQHQGTTAQPFTYAGQFGVRQEDAATGSGAATLFQMGARYYDAATGRFLSREPLWPHPADPRQLNPYAYAFNDPAGFADQSGLAPVTTDSYRWEFSWYSGGMMHSVYGVASGTGSWLLPGIGMVAPPPAPKPSALQARWIASCGGNTQAFNKMLGLIASHMGSGSAGPGYYDISENASWHVPYGEGWLNPIIGAQQSTGTTGAPDYGAYTFGSLSYINQAAFAATGSNWWGYSPSAAYGYDYGPGTYGASMAGVTTLLPSQSLSSGPYAFGSLDYLFQTALHAPLWDYVFPSMGYGYDTGPMTFGGPFGGPFSYAPYGGPFSYPP